MKIKITARQGYSDRFGDWHEFGDIAELPDHVATKLLAAGIATAVRDKPVERAVVKPKETASKRGRKGAK